MIEPADLDWRSGQPYSRTYGDIYHDADGVREVENVFLAPAKFDELLADRTGVLAGELGFGTGLNFAVTARHCLAAGRSLHFVSFEAAPLAPDSFKQIARARQRDEPVYAEFDHCYPPLIHGWHHRVFADGRIRLSVFWGDASSGLSSLVNRAQQPFDLWLLDGFAPDRNPGMWTPELMAGIAAVSRKGTQVTTFSAAGRVRRALTEAGFRMRRVDQRPYKRESLAGTFEPPGLSGKPPPTSVRVIGAGIAGATVARELAMAGMEVSVFEAAPDIASGASSIPVTVMHPRLHHDGSPLATLKATAWAHALAACQAFMRSSDECGLERTGALQIASPNYPQERLAAVAARYAGSGLNLELLDAREASALSGVKIDASALYFPDACLVDTPRLCHTLLTHPRIRITNGRAIDDWPQGPTVLACGSAAQKFPGAEYLELGTVHGQLDLVSATAGPLTGLRMPVVGNGYVAPRPGEPTLFGAGATYEYEPWPVQQASERNFLHLDRVAAGTYSPVGHKKAPRSVSSDRNPIIGNLYDLERQPCVDRFVTTGHGSMGTVTTHIAATLISAAMTGAFAPLADSQLELISPLRFRLRQARRGYRFGAHAGESAD